MKAQITEIFESVNGEVSRWGQGRICTFVRFHGCNLNCEYCDTPIAKDPVFKREMSIQEAMEEIGSAVNITITGGEPLLQYEFVTDLINAMPHAFFTIETNGTIDLSIIKPRIKFPKHLCIVADFKGDLRTNLNAMAIEDEMIFRQKILSNLDANDYVKIVIKNNDDIADAFWWINAQARWAQMNCESLPAFAVSPIIKETPENDIEGPLYYTDIDMRALVNVFRKTPVILNVQLHKFVGLK